MSAPSCRTCRHVEYDSGELPVGYGPSYDCGAPAVDDALFDRDEADDPAWLAAHCGHYDPIPAGHCGQCRNPIDGPRHAVAHWCDEPWADEPTPACCPECAAASVLDAERQLWLDHQEWGEDRLPPGSTARDLTGCDV